MSDKEAVKALFTYIDSFKDDFVKLYGKQRVEETYKAVKSILFSNEKLMSCDRLSILESIRNIFLTGINIEPFYQHGYLSAIYDTNKKKNICKLGAMQKGLFFIAYKSDLITTINMNVVKENDVFKHSIGTEEVFLHEIDLNKPRGKTIGAYCIIVFKDGYKSYTVMGMDEIQNCKKSSKQNHIWEAHFDEMCKKTVGKRATKTLNYPSMQLLVNLDEEVEYGGFEKPTVIKKQNSKDAILSACSRYSEQEECTNEDEQEIPPGLSDIPF